MILLLCLLFFGLSWLLALTVYQLPVWCQSWTLTSVWGIMMLITIYTMVYPEMWPHTRNLAALFLAAYPGMLALEFWQRRDRVWYWEKQGVPLSEIKRGVHSGMLEWLNDKLDRWALKRAMQIIEMDQKLAAVEEAQRVVEKCK